MAKKVKEEVVKDYYGTEVRVGDKVVVRCPLGLWDGDHRAREVKEIDTGAETVGLPGKWRPEQLDFVSAGSVRKVT